MKINKVEALYIHIPFCEHLCDYCDFPKLQYFTKFAKEYLLALSNEIKYRKVQGDFKTIYIGGGTPTSLTDEEFKELLEMIKPFSKKVKEYTIEANPESLTINKLKLMKEYGVNRISIGVESTSDQVLSSINRHHTFKDVKNAVNNAKKVGIDNLNVDLIIGLPHVSFNMLKEDIDNLLSLDVKHISTYSLTVHKNTVFFLKGIKEEKEDISRDKYDYIHETLTKNGFNHYEVSNFAKNGFESKHNMVYWMNEHYFGLGLGASGYLDNIRYTNTRNFSKYISNEFEEEKEIVTIKDLKTYELMLKLRTNIGIDLKSYKDKFNEDLLLSSGINKQIKAQNLYIKNNHLIPTYNGMMLLDNILMDII